MERVTNEDWMMVFFTKAAASLQCDDITVDNWFVPSLHSPHISFSSATRTHSHSECVRLLTRTNKQLSTAKPRPGVPAIFQSSCWWNVTLYFYSVTYKASHSSNRDHRVTHCINSAGHPSTDWIFRVCCGKKDRDHFAGKWWQYEEGDEKLNAAPSASPLQIITQATHFRIKIV